MDIVYAIGMFLLYVPRSITLTHRAADVPTKGRDHKPLEDVVIYDSGEVRLSNHNCH